MSRLQEAIKEACEQHGDVHFRNNYSGRGMYGRSCVGITGSLTECQRVIAAVILELSSNVVTIATEVDDPDFSATQEDFNEAEQGFIADIHMLTGWDQDSMGHDVILYWSLLTPLVEPEEQPWSQEELERGRAM